MVNVTPTQFIDGKGYERMTGRWSQAVGEIFLDWLSLSPDLRWIDVGCGIGIPNIRSALHLVSISS